MDIFPCEGSVKQTRIRIKVCVRSICRKLNFRISDFLKASFCGKFCFFTPLFWKILLDQRKGTKGTRHNRKYADKTKYT